MQEITTDELANEELSIVLVFFVSTLMVSLVVLHARVIAMDESINKYLIY